MKTLAIVAVVIVSSGCATMLGRSPDRVLVASTPTGANVYTGGALVGTTPTVIDPPDTEILIEMSGLEYRVRLRQEASPWLWADIPAGFLTGLVGFGFARMACDECDLRPTIVPGVFTSLIPIIVDLVSGKAFRYPSSIHVRIAPPGSRALDGDSDPQSLWPGPAWTGASRPSTTSHGTPRITGFRPEPPARGSNR